MSLKNAKILTISQSIQPFMDGPEEMAKVARHLPQGILDLGNEIRVFMPKFGCINERRHQLHEVIRLSGMNLIINDTDHALLIKVASVPSARMQVYFIDNEEYFRRKADTHDAEGCFFPDNDERALFFGRGVLETVRKLGWVPDIIHCHGWMTAFVPLYVRHHFADDPHFENTKLVFSVHDQKSEALDKDLAKKLVMEGFDKELFKGLAKPNTDELVKFAMGLSDAVVRSTAKLSKGLETAVKAYDKPVMPFVADGDPVKAHAEFYQTILEEALV
ncbi:MAG TPA: glycogen/starch synthase [Flavobacteriales bacterium]|nr:glycogen/starch synthase [Flavobacteriales bacterium]HNU55041.1 glycogen/starch synthase [Flavobacteriales bacterium]